MVTEELNWVNGEARSKAGNLYSVVRLSDTVWITKWNGTQFPGWSYSKAHAEEVARQHLNDTKPKKGDL